MVSGQRGLSIIAGLCAVLFLGADSTRFHGPDGSGVFGDKGTPVKWSATENLVWKTALPGFGASSPITLGDKVFVTCYSGYGLDQDRAGELQGLQFHLVAIDRASGKILWNKTHQARQPELEYR